MGLVAKHTRQKNHDGFLIKLKVSNSRWKKEIKMSIFIFYDDENGGVAWYGGMSVWL